MTSFWSGWIIILTSICLALTTWLLFANRSGKGGPGATTGHSYDGIEEYDNPMPGWWFWMFVATLVFGVVYAAAYPGMGSYKGFLGWTSTGQWQREVDQAKGLYGPVFAKYAAMPIEEVVNDPKALKMGQRIFANNCSQCHGSDASGGYGFPSLTDKDWLYGGDASTIKTSITEGRAGQMPAWGQILGGDVDNVVAYVVSLSGRNADAEKTKQGQTKYNLYCIACHGPEGKGNPMMGAPNLADNIWLYGGSESRIKQSVSEGRGGNMPAHKDMLNSDKIHLVAAYVYSLSR